MDDEQRLAEVEHRLEQATSGDEIVRLRARRSVLQERIGYSTPHNFGPVTKGHASRKPKGMRGPEDPITFALNKHKGKGKGKGSIHHMLGI